MQTLTPTAVRLNNLSGSAADLDDSPDSPDGNWCTRLGFTAWTASPSVGTLRVVGQTPSIPGDLYDWGATTHYVSASATGTGNAGTIGDPWTIAEAMGYNPSGARTVIEFLPGAYAVSGGGLNSPRAGSYPQYSGTESNPIVFKATNPAATSVSDLSTITVSSSGQCLCFYGSPDYVVFDGFKFEPNTGDYTLDDGLSLVSAYSASVGDSVGCRIVRCLFDTHGMGSGTSYNWGCIYIQRFPNLEISDNKFQNTTGSGSENLAAILTYSQHATQIHHNTFVDCARPMFFKGINDTLQNTATVHHNLMTGVYVGFDLGGINQDSNSGWCDFYQNIVVADASLSQSYAGVFRNYNGTIPRWVRMVNNTFVGFKGANSEAWLWTNTCNGASNLSGCEFRNNVYSLGSGVRAFYGGYGTLASLQRITFSNNCYYGSTTYLVDHDATGISLATWQSTYSEDADSISSDPLLDGSYKLGTGSPCLDAGLDVLDLLGGGTSGEVNMGAYILADQSDEIGARS